MPFFVGEGGKAARQTSQSPTLFLLGVSEISNVSKGPRPTTTTTTPHCAPDGPAHRHPWGAQGGRVGVEPKSLFPSWRVCGPAPTPPRSKHTHRMMSPLLHLQPTHPPTHTSHHHHGSVCPTRAHGPHVRPAAAAVPAAAAATPPTPPIRAAASPPPTKLLPAARGHQPLGLGGKRRPADVLGRLAFLPDRGHPHRGARGGALHALETH